MTTGEREQPRCTVRYWAAAREAAGVSSEEVAAGTLADVLHVLRARSPRLAEVVSRSAFLVDGVPAGRRDPTQVLLHRGSVVDVLPPFAGGAR